MLLMLKLAALAIVLYGNGAGANIFGDGNPSNGTEDDRHSTNDHQATGDALDSWQLSAGSITCDGKVRGTGVLLDVGQYSAAPHATYLASAAHVFYDLASKRLFHACQFNFMGLSVLPGEQAEINPRDVRMGTFSPASDVRAVTFGQGDWALAALPDFHPHEPRIGKLRPAVFGSSINTGAHPDQYLFIGFNPRLGQIEQSGHCQVVPSTPGDLGGGAWPGQLLDDCDSDEGASGGGLVRIRNGRFQLVGVRSGSHWSANRYPPDRYPQGPPAGDPWDIHDNTNFGRAFDPEILQALCRLVAITEGQAKCRQEDAKQAVSP